MSDTCKIATQGSEEGREGREGRLSDEELTDEMCSQAAHLAVAECQFVLLAAEFDRRELWGDGECRSCAHWLNWRCGISLGTAREQVRVGRALERLESVRAAFATGELSYSKVRAITRVATPELEEMFLGLARLATASQLEQIVREYRKADPEEGRRALELHRSRYLRTYTDEEGTLVIRARLSPEDGAMVLAAIEMARQSIREDITEDPPPDVSAETSFETVTADALVAVCEWVVGGGMEAAAEEPRVSVVVHVDEQVLEDPMSEGCSFIEGVGAVASHTARRLACDAAVSKVVFRADGNVEPEGKGHAIPRRIRRAVLARDRGCRFPGCTQRKFVDVHHVVYWSEGGPTRASNLVALCRFHHRRVHEGGYTMEMSNTGAIRLWANDGTEVPSVPAPARPKDPSLRERHRREGLVIGPQTLAYGYNEAFDLDITTGCLLEAKKPRE